MTANHATGWMVGNTGVGFLLGGVTAVFSIVEAAMLRPLPFQDSGRLISLHERFEHDSDELRVSAPDVLTFQRESEDLFAVGGSIASAYELTGAGAPFKARAERVTSSLARSPA